MKQKNKELTEGIIDCGNVRDGKEIPNTINLGDGKRAKHGDKVALPTEQAAELASAGKFRRP